MNSHRNKLRNFQVKVSASTPLQNDNKRRMVEKLKEMKEAQSKGKTPKNNMFECLPYDDLGSNM